MRKSNLESVYEQPDTPQEGKKYIGTTLATELGHYTGRAPWYWATRVLAEQRTLLEQHENVQMLVGSCRSPEEMVDRHDEILSAVEEFSTKSEANFSGDFPGFCFRQIQLFEVISSFVLGLLELAHCWEAVAVTAAWFGVPRERRRKSPVIAAVPGYGAGALYAVDSEFFLVEGDTTTAIRKLIDAVNVAYDLSIVVREDISLPVRAQEGRRGISSRFRDELADATSEYYELDRAAEFLREWAQGSLGIFQPHVVHAPFIALAHSRLGITWPTVTSYEEPAQDRPVKKVLIWSYGTILGGREARAVASILEPAGVECVLIADEKLSPDQFLGQYTDESYDAIWIIAHGAFDSREPHRAYIELSSEKSYPVYLTDLLRCSVSGSGRRLLFLNICLGGSVLVSQAPTKLGLGAMLESANQAVVSHFEEVSGFVAPLFGAAMAISIANGNTFFASFADALDAIRLDRAEAIDLVKNAVPQCSEFMEWITSGTYGVDQNDIRTWGTPVFFE